MTNRHLRQKGFTLIEFMMVATIIAIAAVIGLASNYFTSQRKARDSERKSDLNQYRIALETYASAHNELYPIETSPCQAHLSTCVCDALTDPYPYLSTCLQDPKQGPTYNYNYQTDATGTKYILWARLEAVSGGTVRYWYVCFDGRTSEKTSQPTASDCGIT
jgi:prepilin-type N-terminal cleavage/methylation domain-containing protein